MEISRENLIKITDYIWEIPKQSREDMRVPALIFASAKMLDEVFKDRSVRQLVNVATLPGIQGQALVMPDVHEGYGFPIGGVAATEWPGGIISPGGIGYDINCGVRLLKSEKKISEVREKIAILAQEFYRTIPSGVGRGGKLKLSLKELDEVLENGAAWVVEKGYGEESDLRFLESFGKMENASASVVSERAKRRGLDQVGTIGAGNHFVEIDLVEEIFDSACAKVFGLFPNQVVVLIHTGSRGLGHQVATDYIRVMQKAMLKYNLRFPDRELAGVPFSSEEGRNYFSAMAAAANFAWANRQMIAWHVRQGWKNILGEEGGKLSVLYDVAHNIAKIEEHEISGEKKKVIVHRKGATRAFGPGQPEIIEEYRSVGQPVIIPGSMGTASYVLAGAKEAMERSFGSSCHGAGRRLSRHAAKRSIRGDRLKEELLKKGICVQVGSLSGLAEEAPLAYKDIHDVVDVVYQTGIAKKVARLRPLAVIKG